MLGFSWLNLVEAMSCNRPALSHETVLHPAQNLSPRDGSKTLGGGCDGETIAVATIDGMIGLILHFSYAKGELKDDGDQAILSSFDGSYLWATLTDPGEAYRILVAAAMASVSHI
jgi:hypothetical protein